MKPLLLSLYFLLCTCISGFSQPSTLPPGLYKPNVILFMLNKSTTKINALKRLGKLDDVKEVERVDQEINFSIIRNFSKYFVYCPVYFFYSDQYDLVKAKNWQEVVFYDADHLSTAKKIEVSSLGNYFIAEVNYPPAPIYEEGELAKQKSGTESGGPENEYANSRDYGILLYNENFELLPTRLKYTNISLAKRGSIWKPSERKYQFVGAKLLQNALRRKLGE